MEKSRKWSYQIFVAFDFSFLIFNVYGQIHAWRDGQFITAGVSSLFAAACAIAAWAVIKTEEKARIDLKTRESYLREQEADTNLKEEILAHFRQMKERDPDFSFGFPIDMRSKH